MWQASINKSSNHIVIWISIASCFLIQGASCNLFIPIPSIEPAIDCPSSLVDDRDEKSYVTVVIGKQCWMAENLNHGTPITADTGIMEMKLVASDDGMVQKYCYDNDPENCRISGGLYQIKEAREGGGTSNESKDICPNGWQLPTSADWDSLEVFLGVPIDELSVESDIDIGREMGVGDQLKFPNNEYCIKESFCGLSKFNVLLNGRYGVGEGGPALNNKLTFRDKGSIGAFISRDETVDGVRLLANSKSGIIHVNTNPKNTYSVRCIKTQ